MPAASSPGGARVTCYRVCDRRYPFLWASQDQPPGRWHGAGEGPVHYLATSAKGAWAEVLRHEHITDLDDLVDLELSLWAVAVPEPADVPQLADDTLLGDETSYPDCQAEARRLRAHGATGLRAAVCRSAIRANRVICGGCCRHVPGRRGAHVGLCAVRRARRPVGARPGRNTGSRRASRAWGPRRHQAPVSRLPRSVVT